MLFPKPEQPTNTRAARYRKARDSFLSRNPVCQRCRIAPAIDVHHAQGRLGDNLLDESKWFAMCRACHDHVERNRAESYAQGWLVRRIE